MLLGLLDRPVRTEVGAVATDLGSLATATPSTRNRAIDAYRALAMVAVALGHWLAADVRIGPTGGLQGGNALGHVGGLQVLTWLFQVMPLFFCIGGYANAASLDAHARAGGSASQWVSNRLRRLCAPAAWLAGTWCAVAVLAPFVGVPRSMVSMAVGIAAIPLWFLANYVADTALAPVTLRMFRQHRARFVLALGAVFLVLELSRFAGIHYLLQANIVLGWLLFQVLGFAWRDGLLGQGVALARRGVVSLAAAAALVAFGPWPLSMVSVPGDRFANTWPPSLALVAYGIGTCFLAIAAAPVVTRLLERRPRVWRAVVAANSFTMTSYLWHFTALIIAALACWKVGLLPTAPAASAAWWLQKLPVIGLSLVVLAVTIALLASRERRALLDVSRIANVAGPERATPTPRMTAALSLALAAGFELWTAAKGQLAIAVPGMALVLVVRVVLQGRPRRAATRSCPPFTPCRRPRRGSAGRISPASPHRCR